ncbi:4-alpha-glucanotransferase [Haliangium ochraceum]|uniref:4-alpha-glucanotransferase n=1 Tax=Haliangium ochraceum (strain DSM 14365 / JCM 11303 / SMP-2) TaxID=502025 RepID=D0LZ08_HALO1|nr:4-alpha-glucanotransferase [Haliangium ochraceum]ACY14478.1 4-alpha-glucanotransferase [Haliangium ochraceum DSM 14365]
MNAELKTLAELTGVLLSYHDGTGQLRECTPEALIHILQLLGVEIAGEEDASAALVRYRREQWETFVPPCLVAWDGAPAALSIQLPASEGGAYSVTLTLESGETRRVQGRLDEIEPAETALVDGVTYTRRVVSVPVGEHGYHELSIEAGGQRGTCSVFAAPLSAYRPQPNKRWGVFAPLYAMQRQGGTGIGDLADLRKTARWVGELGGSFVGTLPLLASYLDEPYEFSPYGPVSRMFWNELYLDLTSAPGLLTCTAAQKLMAGAPFANEAAELSALPQVDYRRQMALRRGVIDALAASAWDDASLRGELEAYQARSARVDDYARFRALTDTHRKVWRDWPEAQRAGRIAEGEVDEARRRYHVYAQYSMEAQLARLAHESGVTLYLDLPVGVHRYGYDTWRDREVFALGASAGAPPDGLFSEGQNWGAAPLHPWGLRKNRYRYFIDAVRAHLAHAGMLRVDHAMGLHRMYWVPEGYSGKDGVYVHYNAGEMYAILSIESHRQECAVTGEDLGTVPDYVRPSMERHGLSRLYVGMFSLPEYDGGPILPPPANVVASINTHDTPTWGGFWNGDDIDIRCEMGLIDAEQVAAERAGREQTFERLSSYLRSEGFLGPQEPATAASLMRAFTAYLAASDAELIIVTLEDLWLEEKPQNVPGTGPDERPNWQRKLSRELGEVLADPEVRALLEMVDQTRRAVAGGDA